MRRWALLGGLLLWAGVVQGCGQSAPAPPADLGGATTREETSQNSFGLPAPALTNTERRRFEVGDSFFTQNWVTAPASTDARDGLGPTFNAQACSSCHVLDGRGQLPRSAEDEAAGLGLLVRLSVPGEDPATGAPVPDPTYGGQLQDKAILDVPAEGTLQLDWEEVDGSYADGTPWSLRKPLLEMTDLQFGPMHPDVLTSPRLAPQIIGMGLLEAVPEADIRAAADPDDTDGDGISGRANEVWDARAESTALGRFGWKANVATVEQQVAGAFHGDIGITSSLHPEQDCTPLQLACLAAVSGGEPELTADRLQSVTFYTKTLSVPAMRDNDSEAVRNGAQAFEELGCASCHTPTLTTGDSPIATLSNQTFHPYTDLLLHDMGEGLADNRPDFAADGSEWRTPPLWGLGLIDDVNTKRNLMHDGRARTPEEAILWHGGEAEASRQQFVDASAGQRNDLLAFLEAL